MITSAYTDEKLLRVLGMISGTSVDAIDVALCEFAPDSETSPAGLTVRLLVQAEQPFPPQLRTRVLSLFETGQARLADLTELNFDLGEAFAAAALRTLESSGLAPNELDLVASHGQTIWHLMEPGRTPSTWQMGEAAVLSRRLGVTVASNFRVADVAAGGQGAPLVSLLDVLLFGSADVTRAVQNIGGIANVTFLPAGLGVEGAYAFDTGPGNALMDYTTRVLTAGAQNYDKDGAMASRGTPDSAMLSEALAHPYFSLPPPKTTGREMFGDPYAALLIEKAERRGLAPEDILATFAALTAQSIARAYRDFGPSRVDELVLSGGGACNPVLVECLRSELPGLRVRQTEEFGLPGAIKEALAFALLGHECLYGRPSNVPTCTGASSPTVLGNLTPGPNYHRLMARVARAAAEGDACTPTRTIRLRS